MRVALACDHAGFPLKASVAKVITDMGHEVINLGTDTPDVPTDYPDVAQALGRVIQLEEADRGVLICGSGVGTSIAANKLKGVRAAVCHDVYSATQGVEHDYMNVICFGGRVIGSALAAELVKAFLNANFSEEERHVRRLNKVKELEQK
ncbi:MAG: ribose 5-phosphate isomerase B [Candidatus Latescibacteria bacterium]|jgi:ribose 5-phosphate isomerase B|nr:ribose 5-phosphate isomerase B [Candidatus Latescibacterota bacterium]